MSYILDALKKADAERERGNVPGLHARQVTAAAIPRTETGHKGTWLALVAGLVLAGVAALVWDARTPVAAVAPMPAPMAQAPAPAIAPVPASAAVAPAPTVVAAEPAPPPPITRTEPRTPPKPVGVPVASPKPASAVSSVATPTATAVAPLLNELPIDVRSQIPALAISGSVYSDNPSQRLLLVNGQVLPQGSQVAADVTLVEIHRGSSEFSFRGMRFRLAH